MQELSEMSPRLLRSFCHFSHIYAQFSQDPSSSLRNSALFSLSSLSCEMNFSKRTQMLSLTALLLIIAHLSEAEEQTEPGPCTFCTRGEITLPDKPISIPGYEFIQTCGQIDVLLPSYFKEDASECSLMQSLSTYCGCPAVEDSCSLCPDGSAVPDTDKEVPWLAAAFDGIIPSCGLVEAYVASISTDDGTCSSLQAMSGYCGCPAMDDHCVFCPGETLQDEYKDFELPFLSNEEMGITGTCEMFFLTQYQLPKDHEYCALSQHVTFNCGCNNGVLGYYGTSTTQQQAVLAWLPRATAALSLLGSAFIFMDILKDKRKRGSVYHQLVLVCACFDTISSFVWIVGTAAVEVMHKRIGLPWGVYGAHGNIATCTAQGFFFQLGKSGSSVQILVFTSETTSSSPDENTIIQASHPCF